MMKSACFNASHFEFPDLTERDYSCMGSIEVFSLSSDFKIVLCFNGGALYSKKLRRASQIYFLNY